MDDVRVASISCGSSHSLALLSTADGTVVASWGRGEDGQLGHGDAEERQKPQAIYSLLGAKISSVHCGAEYSVAMSAATNHIHAFGWGDFGRLGSGDCRDSFVPTPIQGLSNKTVTSISCGDTHTLVATAEGELYSFGRNSSGQLGLNSTDDALLPQRVEALAGKVVSKVACGAEHSVVLTDNGDVYCFGWGRFGNIGDGHRDDRHVPVKVAALEGVKITQVACGWRHTLAVDDGGILHTWGWNKYGQLGFPDLQDQVYPKRMDSLNTVKLVAGGWHHTLAVDSAGKLFSFGWNKFGQLGLGHNEDVSSPEHVDAFGGESIVLVSSGWRHNLAVTDRGRLFSWGRGVDGQLGLSSAEDKNYPTEIVELSAPTVDVEAIMKEAHPVVMYAIPTVSDRYAVVPDSTTVDGAVPEAKAAKRQKKSG